MPMPAPEQDTIFRFGCEELRVMGSGCPVQLIKVKCLRGCHVNNSCHLSVTKAKPRMAPLMQKTMKLVKSFKR